MSAIVVVSRFDVCVRKVFRPHRRAWNLGNPFAKFKLEAARDEIELSIATDREETTAESNEVLEKARRAHLEALNEGENGPTPAELETRIKDLSRPPLNLVFYS